MSGLLGWLTAPQHLAGIAALVVAVVDRWAFHSAFGAGLDQTLLEGSLVYLGAVQIPSPLQLLTSTTPKAA